MLPVVRAAEQFVRDARLAKASGGPALPFVQRLALAVDAGMRELLPARKSPVARYGSIRLAGTGTMTVGGTVTPAAVLTGSGSLTPPRMVFLGDAGTASDNLAVEVIDSRSGLLGLSYGQLLPLVLIWLIVLVIPALVQQANLSPEIQVTLDAYDGVLAALAVGVTFRFLDKRK